MPDKPNTSEIFLTPQGAKDLQAELDELQNVKRLEVGERIKTAREFGDISENSEYDDAKNEQAWLETRISEINSILAIATIKKAAANANHIAVGHKVEVEQKIGGGAAKKETYTIVGSAEADAANNKLSNESPIGALLFGASVKSTVKGELPNGKKIELKILKIS